MNKEIMKALGYDEQMGLIEQGLCPSCQQPIGEFRDVLSKREFNISGLCQGCQDKVFGR
jgi:hypothetical protein